MNISGWQVGDSVLIAAKDEFYAFVDGWPGRVAGLNNGLVVVECDTPEGVKTFFVPPDQLALNFLRG